MSRIRKGKGRTFRLRRGLGRRRMMLVESFDVWSRVAIKHMDLRIRLISILSLSIRISGSC